ncbi:MAG: TRAP transporter small permease [Alphaproteobacteria bacterium]|nr:TRAP transporter small permease [Alphaproteobacteria bacterium]
MSEGSEQNTRPTDPVGRVLYSIAKWLAVFGGVVLSAMAVLTTVSVIGRSAFLSPIPGDFEIVAIGTGVAVFAFLPWCQMVRGNVIVDFFMSATPPRARIFADIVGGLVYLAIAVILTWRMIFGGIDMYNYNELSMTINFPRWTTFPVSIALLAFLAIVIVYTVGRSIAELRAGEYLDKPDNVA